MFATSFSESHRGGEIWVGIADLLIYFWSSGYVVDPGGGDEKILAVKKRLYLHLRMITFKLSETFFIKCKKT